MSRDFSFTFCLIVLVASSLFAADDPAALPKVVLVGDSIRMSYAPLVAEQLAGRAVVVSSKSNGGDSNNVLKHLDEWVIGEKPAIVHLNCGIHDTKKFTATGKFQVSPKQYETNLRRIVHRIRTETDAIVIFATSTPILDERAAAARQGRDYELLDASIEQYNGIAMQVMNELDVSVNELHHAVAEPDGLFRTEDLIGKDGVHMTLAGVKLLGARVAAFIEEER